MTKHKNLILIVISAILLIYAGFISIFPAILNSSFDIKKFEKKLFEATSLDTTIGSVTFKIEPNFNTIISFYDVDAKYVDRQDLFSAKLIEINTTPSAIFSNNYNIKSLYLKNVKYDDQLLEDGKNKISFLPESFNPKPFGKDMITITPGKITFRNLQCSYTKAVPYSYKKESYSEQTYTKQDVKEYLSTLNFKKVKIK